VNGEHRPAHLRNKARKVRVFRPEFNIALAINVVFLVGTLLGWPPWSSFLNAGEAVKDSWERTDGSPPWGPACGGGLVSSPQALHLVEHFAPTRSMCSSWSSDNRSGFPLLIEISRPRQGNRSAGVKNPIISIG